MTTINIPRFLSNYLLNIKRKKGKGSPLTNNTTFLMKIINILQKTLCKKIKGGIIKEYKSKNTIIEKQKEKDKI
jgi:hypothetical protein